MWTVTVKPEDGDVVTGIGAHLIPVHAGRITVVDWPQSLARAFARSGTGRLEILRAKTKGPQATVDVSLVGVKEKTLLPTIKNMAVFEAGMAGTVRSVDLLATPLDVVLLLDSSGSMKGSMKQALEATTRFVKRLPASARVTVVDFDTTPKVLPGTTRSELLEALKVVRARGATALYDSIILGLKRLTGANRPALLVFTDGVDANWNDTAPGSKATKPQVLAGVKKTDVPVFTHRVR